MSAERLESSDKKVLLIWILAGVLGASVAYRYFYRAFPEASVQFKVPRAAALEQAREFAVSQGARLNGWQSSIIFDVDDTAKTYLEREVGLQQANRMMAGDIHIWFWQTRFFRPLQKEEFDVRVNPAGGITGFEHVLEETSPGARLDRAPAQAIAESFLRNTLHADLARYDFLDQEANLTERPNRRDWSFTWERRNFRAKDAPYRLNVTLGGDHVDGYEETLKVPEMWTRGYEHLRSYNNLIEYVALIPYSILLGGCLYVIFALGRRGLINWHGGLALGVFLTALYFLMTMNQLPLERAGYDTNTPYTTFWLSQTGEAVLESLLSALLVVVAVVPAEPLYRVWRPAKIRLGAGLRLSGIRTKEFLCAGVIGICLAAAHIGYITVFYIVSGKFGAWAPQDLNYTDVVSTPLPWVYPLAIGIYAATSEEFLFRLFAIPFLLRTTKSKFLAVVLPAFAWGFLHSNYPQEPPYIRGIEVGLIGIVAGLVMLRWGIWATLTWHYTVDAFLISTSLLRSSGAYLRVMGAVVGGGALIPLAVAGISYLWRGTFEADASLLNSSRPLAEPREAALSGASGMAAPARPAEPAGEAPGVSAPSSEYTAMSGRTLAVLAGCGLLGAALLAGVHREAIGDFVRFEINASAATSLSNQVLREHKLDPATFQHAATMAYTFDPYTDEYLSRAIGVAAANRIYRDEVPSAFWAVRYFRDSQTEEYLVVLRPDGSLHSIHHTLDESAAGANLTKEDALRRAEAYLREVKKFDLSSWKLVETNSEKRPARTDHTFEWEQIARLDPGAAGPGAHIRMQLRVQGDEVSGYRIFIKIPDAWRDTESRTTVPQIAQTLGLVLLAAVALVTALAVFVRSLKHPEITRVPWPRVAKWTAWMLPAAIVIYANRAPALLANYPTAWPLGTFYGVLLISLLFVVALYLAATLLLLGLAWLFLDRALGCGRIPGWIGMPAGYYRDALAIAAFGAAAAMGANRLPDWFERWPILRHFRDPAVPGGLDALSPAAGTIASAAAAGFIALGVLGLAAGLIASYIRPRSARIGLAILLAVLAARNVASPGAFAREAAFRLFLIGAVWLGVACIARFNLLGYFLAAAMAVLTPGAFELLEQPNAYFRANGYAVAAFALALLAWPLLVWSRKPATP